MEKWIHRKRRAYGRHVSNRCTDAPGSAHWVPEPESGFLNLTCVTIEDRSVPNNPHRRRSRLGRAIRSRAEVNLPRTAARIRGTLIVMSAAAKRIIEAALKLDPTERTHVAHELLESITGSVNGGLDAEWVKELEQRACSSTRTRGSIGADDRRDERSRYELASASVPKAQIT